MCTSEKQSLARGLDRVVNLAEPLSVKVTRVEIITNKVLAGSVIKGVPADGSTDDRADYLIENKRPVAALHTTIFHLLG
ncbi:MAG: hypothetical protein GY768_16830 [Planctomycetaceae bacterium]|nr:hypothetical protein [Planctomycetaceae bacterium]